MGEIGVADEVIEAFDGDAIEVEVSGHSSRFGGGFDEVDFVTIFGGSISRSKSHGTCANDNNSGHSLISLGGANGLTQLYPTMSEVKSVSVEGDASLFG